MGFLVHILENEICKCLPAMHFLTGYDTTNVLFKIGKKKNSIRCASTKFALAFVKNKTETIIVC
jgi:hypothetical protein